MRTKVWGLVIGLVTVALVAVFGPRAMSGEDGGGVRHEFPELPFAMPDLVEPVFADRNFPITDFGATAGGEVSNTDAIARAIAACSESGGGRVVVPSGKWLTGPIHLLSKVNLHLDQGAELVFSTEPDDYLPVVFTRWEGIECYNYSPLIYARGAENIAVTGPGVLNGRGGAWWDWKVKQRAAVKRLYDAEHFGVPVSERVFGTKQDAMRPHLVQLVDCRNVLLAGYTAKDSPFWTNHLVYCENVVVRGLTVRAPAGSPNTDGVNFDSCKNVFLSGLDVATGDDAVCVKSGRDEDGRRVGRPCENVVIEKVHSTRTHGGFVVGSEMSGGIRNIMVRDCFWEKAQNGIRIKGRKGRGGFIEDIWMENLRMGRISDVAVSIDMYYAYQASPGWTDLAPRVRGLHVKGVSCDFAYRAAVVRGLPSEPMTDLTFEDLQIKSWSGFELSTVSKVLIDGLKLKNLWGPTFKFENTQEVTVRNSSGPGMTTMTVKGDESKGINFEDPPGKKPHFKVKLGGADSKDGRPRIEIGGKDLEMEKE